MIHSRDGYSAWEEDTEFIDVYTYDRRDDDPPTLQFSDANIVSLKYELTAYIMNSTRANPIIEVKPERMYADVDTEKRGIVAGNQFTLPKMEYDGIYALKIIAVDAAGNESEPNINTYVRMVDHDVLACIEEDSLYSFQYENGDAISKREDDFRDIVIYVIAREDSDIRVVLRDTDGNEINTDARSSKPNTKVYGIRMSDYTVESDFFKDYFPDDTDIQLYLSVMSEENRIDRGKIHIDNIAPTCQLPTDLKSWQWYYGDGTRTFVISGISEPLKEWKLYDNGTELIPDCCGQALL